MFEGFDHRDVEVDRGTVHVVVGGVGPPLLLLHGWPETHLMWHAVAPVLAEHFTVVVADLPGYGDSQAPVPAADHAPHSKRAMAADLVQAMAGLGHERFALAGHDRGGRVGYRMALDSPQSLTALAVLDIVPTAEVWARANDRFAFAYWHWAFLARPAPQPEQMVLAAPAETFFAHHFEMIRRGAPGHPIEVVQDYVDRIVNPAAVQGMCEDYRAGAGIDRELDEADRTAGRRIACPLLVLWGEHGALPGLYGDGEAVLEIWRDWADDVRGHVLPASHFIPEDEPQPTAAALLDFFTP